MTIAQIVRAKMNGQREAAARLGITESQMSRYINGQREMPKSIAKKLATITKTMLDVSGKDEWVFIPVTIRNVRNNKGAIRAK